MPDLGPVELSLKPMLAECLHEAVKLALIDSCWPVDPSTGEDRAESWTEEERLEFRRDIHKMPGSALSNMDPVALAQNVCCRLLGTGGWTLPDGNGGAIYAGNATTREVFDATFERPDQDVIAELAFDMGLKPSGDGMFEMPGDDEDDPDAPRETHQHGEDD